MLRFILAKLKNMIKVFIVFYLFSHSFLYYLNDACDIAFADWTLFFVKLLITLFAESVVPAWFKDYRPDISVANNAIAILSLVLASSLLFVGLHFLSLSFYQVLHN
jgi:hypothetical protein